MSAESPESDLILTLRPRFLLLAEGPRLKLTGAGSFNAIYYTQKTQESRVLPDFDLAATALLIERALTLEAGARVSQVFENPFGLRVDTGTITSNRVTTTQLRLSPVIDIRSNNGQRFYLRSDNIQVDDDQSSELGVVQTATGYFGHHQVSLEQAPRPFGARAEFDRTDTRYDTSLSRPLISDVARLVATYALSERFQFGIRGGMERNNFVIGDQTSSVYGVELEWRPSERTNLFGAIEHRYFGTGGRLVFDHRTPWVAWNLLISRGLVSTPQTLFNLPPTANVAALLDQLYTTRFPDPIARARQVQEVISRGGLPPSLTQPTTVYTQRISLESLVNARVAYIGTRSSVALSAFWSQLEDAPDSSAVLNAALAVNNNVQQGVTLSGSRRLTPLTTLRVAVDRSRIRALPTSVEPQRVTDQRSFRTDLTFQLAPRTSAHAGFRYTRFTESDTTDNDEDAVFLGLDHRF